MEFGPISFVWLIFGVLAALQLLLAFCMGISLLVAARERRTLHREMFGLLKKIEGLTATRREQMIRHYDRMLEGLSLRLPPAIAAQASSRIFDMESRILTRLSELEGSQGQDQSNRAKMEELVKSMESLEQTVVALTSETVKTVMLDSRKRLLDDDSFEESLAA